MRRLARLILLATLLVPALALATEAPFRPGFPRDLPGAQVRFGSVTLADIHGDARPEILVGASDGRLYALNPDGTILWNADLSPVVNATAAAAGRTPSANPIPIRSAPAVGDLDNDGAKEVVVALGEVFAQGAPGVLPTHGAVVVLNNIGQIRPGWPQLGRDIGGGGGNLGSPDGYADGIVASPALGNIDDDPELEIIYGGFDQHIDARNPDGSTLPGWPRWAYDTIWSSPALGDLDGDGALDVVIGVDAHFEPAYGTLDGGYVYALRGDGSFLPGWPQFQDEIVMSAPALGDIDDDGRLEVVVGSGDFYSNLGRDVGKYVSAWNHDGALLWRHPLPDQALGSPALGDLNADGILDVVIGAQDKRIYALNGPNGAQLWATEPRDIFNQAYALGSPILADITGDNRPDVLINLGWEVGILDGATGAQLTATAPQNDARPSYYGSHSILGTPAVGDLDNDGGLDLVAASATNGGAQGRVFAWALPGSAPAAWPMLRGNPRHTGLAALPRITVAPATVAAVMAPGSQRTFSLPISVSGDTGAAWTLTETADSANIATVAPNSGSGPATTVTLAAPAAPGSYTATYVASAPGAPSVNVTFNVVVVADPARVLVPTLRR